MQNSRTADFLECRCLLSAFTSCSTEYSCRDFGNRVGACCCIHLKHHFTLPTEIGSARGMLTGTKFALRAWGEGPCTCARSVVDCRQQQDTEWVTRRLARLNCVLFVVSRVVSKGACFRLESVSVHRAMRNPRPYCFWGDLTFPFANNRSTLTCVRNKESCNGQPNNEGRCVAGHLSSVRRRVCCFAYVGTSAGDYLTLA